MSVGKNISIFVNGHDLACALQRFEPNGEREELDATVLCTDARQYEAGFKSLSAAASGVWKYDSVLADQIHEVMSAAFNGGTELLVTSSIELATFGNPAILMKAIDRQFAISSPLGQLITVRLTLRSTDEVGFGQWYVNGQLDAGTADSASIDNGAASDDGGLFHAHLHNDDATDVDVILQHSVDDSVWVDLATVPNLSAVRDAGAIAIPRGTTIQRYTRVRTAVTGGNTERVTAAFARF